MATILLSLGTNLGRRRKNLRDAVRGLAAAGSITAVSPIYETAPWGPIQDQPNFYNLCLSMESAMGPQQLLRFVKTLEETIGRADGERWGPRLIDIDLLFYDDLVLHNHTLTIPHRQIAERAFVLVPLADLAPEFVHPQEEKTVAELLAAVDTADVTRLPRPLDLEELSAVSV